jgi:hypothetical protein
MRHMAMRVIEAIYFIVILPMTVKTEDTIETSRSVLISSYVAFSCILNLTFFLTFYMIKKKSLDWKTFYEMNGFWKEIGTATGRE